MRIQIASDLHLDHWAPDNRALGRSDDEIFDQLSGCGADVLVLAGDIFRLSARAYSQTSDWIKKFLDRWRNVVYVPGNHEFYGTDIDTGLEILEQLDDDFPRFHPLFAGSPVTIEGQRFLGATMWFPKSFRGRKIYDFTAIRKFEPEVYRQHQQFKDYMVGELKSDDVVVTHHAPSDKSIALVWQGDPANDYFCVPSIEQEIIGVFDPKLWIHGHMHMSFDYMCDNGKTRVVCNPRGYPNEVGPTFNPNLVVTL